MKLKETLCVLLNHMQRFSYIFSSHGSYPKECKYFHSWRCLWDLQCIVLALLFLKILNSGCFNTIFVLSTHTGSWHFFLIHEEQKHMGYFLSCADAWTMVQWTVQPGGISQDKLHFPYLARISCLVSKLACSQVETQHWDKVESWKIVAVLVLYISQIYVFNMTTDVIRQMRGGYAIENCQNNLVQNSNLCNGTERNFSLATVAEGCFLWYY